MPRFEQYADLQTVRHHSFFGLACGRRCPQVAVRHAVVVCEASEEHAESFRSRAIIDAGDLGLGERSSRVDEKLLVADRDRATVEPNDLSRPRFSSEKRAQFTDRGGELRIRSLSIHGRCQ